MSFEDPYESNSMQRGVHTDSNFTLPPIKGVRSYKYIGIGDDMIARA